MTSKLEEHLFSGFVGALIGAPAAALFWLGLSPLFGLGVGWAWFFFGLVVAAALVAPSHFGEMLATILRFVMRVFPS